MNITLIGRDDCPLCDKARTTIRDVIDGQADVEFEEVSVEDNPLWHELYGELIPVVLINGEEHAHWKVDADSLRQAIHHATDLAS